MQVRKFKSIDDTNLADATKTTYNRYFISLFTWCDSTEHYDPFVKIPNPKIQGEMMYDIEASQQQLLTLTDEQLQIMLENFLEYQKERVEDDIISPNSVPKFFKPYKYLLEINYREHAVMWKPLSKMYPKMEKRSGFRPWSTEQINEMVSVVSSFNGSMARFRNKAAVLTHASTGGRVGIHNDPLLMKHMVKMTHPDFAYHFYAILIYAEEGETVSEKDQRILTDEIDDEDYSKFVFLIPEAARALDEYHAYRKKNGEIFDDETPLFTIVKEFDNRVSPDVKKQMSGNAFRHVMEYILAKSTIVRKKKRNRFSTMIDHGFRKRYNTILKGINGINSNKAEALMQHIKGLDGAYLKFTRKELFSEIVKGALALTVDPTERQKNTIKSAEEEILELKKKNRKLQDLAEKSKLNEEKLKYYEPYLEKIVKEVEEREKQELASAS